MTDSYKFPIGTRVQTIVHTISNTGALVTGTVVGYGSRQRTLLVQTADWGTLAVEPSKATRAVDPDMLERANELGAEAGTALAGWVEIPDPAALVAAIDDGDPEVWDMYAAPLSGQWADEYMAHDLASDIGYRGEREDLEPYEDAYVTAHGDAWYAELERRARYQIAGE